MKKVQAFLFVAVIALMFSSGSCKKQTCGCDGEVKFELNQVPGTINYEDTKFSYFISDGIYSYFTICDPEKVWDQISKFKNGEHVIVTGKAMDDCMKQMSYYYSSNYVLQLEEIKRPEF